MSSSLRCLHNNTVVSVDFEIRIRGGDHKRASLVAEWRSGHENHISTVHEQKALSLVESDFALGYSMDSDWSHKPNPSVDRPPWPEL